VTRGGSYGLFFFKMLIVLKFTVRFEPEFVRKQVQSGILQGRMETKRKAQRLPGGMAVYLKVSGVPLALH